MKRQFTAITAAGLLILTLCGAVFAAENPLPELIIEKTEVFLYEQLPLPKLASEYGVQELLNVDGKKLLSVNLIVQPQWTEEIENARVEDNDIKFVTDQGEEIPMIGCFERYGIFVMETNSFSSYRNYDWKEKANPVYYNAVFAIPDGVKSGQFKLGELTAVIQVPDKANPTPAPADTVKIEIESAAFVEKIQSANSVGNIEPKPVSTISNPKGKVLEVKVNVNPLIGNGDNPDHFFWYTPWFGIMTDAGRYIPTFGEIFMEKLTNNVSHNLNRESDGTWSKGSASLYFAVPANVKTFKLYYQGQHLTDGAVK